MSSPHLWLALSPHGFGHSAMTSPVIAELRRRAPDLRLTIQTTVDPAFLRSRYHDFDHIRAIADFGFRMVSATGIDLNASARDYADLLGRFDAEVDSNARAMARAKPDLILSNVAFVPLAAAARLGIPSLALSSLNWADMYRHYLGDRPEAPAVLARLREAYHCAELFLRCTPSQEMTLDNLYAIGPVAKVGMSQPLGLRTTLGREEGQRVGLVAFGGIDHDVDMRQWPSIPGWLWLTTQTGVERPDLLHWQRGGLDFPDLIASVDVVVTKTGYGTFTEAAMVGTPVLYTERPDWPESPHLDRWLAAHTKALAVPASRLGDGALPELLQMLFSLPDQPVAYPSGVDEAADLLMRYLS